ncbi:nitrous oxide reductase accessory protein NosL [Coralliovum pocilloporae]|uniref:nitrous oxide reductase accessory protein NosL n=1 Tax=Coralliovum pocilloporae TaxID=3066369 RepID=UPI0033079712
MMFETSKKICLGIALAASMLTACQEEQIVVPDAVSMTREAVGHYCQMIILDHEGPKAQIHLKGNPFPVFFSQVRDAIAFMRLPEETQEVTAIYLSDMGQAESWSDPGADNWMLLDDAIFVIDSKARGGMGGPETVPFKTRADAEAFIARQGGRIVALNDISDDYVLAPVDVGNVLDSHGLNHGETALR